MNQRIIVAVVQMDTGENKEDNLNKISAKVKEAAEKNVELICFPEMVNIQSAELTPFQRAEDLNGRTIAFFSELAKKHGVMICCGTILEKIPNAEKVYNTSVLIDRNGKTCAVYRKRHTFDITMKDGREFRESDTVQPGNEIVLVETDAGMIGYGICYDLRFPEQFRQMSLEGMQLLLLPASFTKETGEAHWETLIRARAIENGCYVLACNQCGIKMEYEAYGNSMIVDPWGQVIAKAGTEEEMLIAEIDLDKVADVRMQIPATISR